MKAMIFLTMFAASSAHAGIKACLVPTTCKATCVYTKTEKVNGVKQDIEKQTEVRAEGDSGFKAYKKILASCKKAGGKSAELMIDVNGQAAKFNMESGCRLAGDMPTPTKPCAITTLCEATCRYSKNVKVDGQPKLTEFSQYVASEHLSPIAAEKAMVGACRKLGGKAATLVGADPFGLSPFHCQLADEKAGGGSLNPFSKFGDF